MDNSRCWNCSYLGFVNGDNMNETCPIHGEPLIWGGVYSHRRQKYACRTIHTAYGKRLEFCTRGLDEEWDAIMEKERKKRKK